MRFERGFGVRFPRYASVLMSILLAALAGRIAGADDLRPIDCSGSPFSVSDQAYDLDCERSEEQAHVDGASGGVRFDVMTISSKDRTLFLTMTSQLITAPRIYLEHRSLSESFRSMFDRKDVGNWNGIGNKAGYDVAEFKTDISGHESSCIAVQRYTNPAWTGYKRHIVGMGCAVAGLEPVYEILSKLSAPGD
jgi:hypothetical protein